MGFLQCGHNVLPWLVSYICTNLAYPICHSVVDTILCTPILDPRARSLYDIFTDPRYSDCKTQSRAIISRRTRRQFLAKGKHKIVPTNARYLVTFSYQVRGAYAYLGTSSHADCTEAIQAASKPVHFDDPLHLSVPYNYHASRLREPPDNTFTRAIDMSHLRPNLLS